VTIWFGPFAHNLETRQVTRDGLAVRLTPKAFDLLTVLITERPTAVSKADLQQRLWPDTFVVEANVSNLIAEVREALGDPARDGGCIRTVHGFGYAFAADTRTEASRAALRPPLCWLEWGERRFPLSSGAHVIGRDPGAEVYLDAASVSRHHARLVVTTDAAVLEDVVSKNGTFRGNQRVTAPVQLADGDELRIGTLRLTFHLQASVHSTETERVSEP